MIGEALEAAWRGADLTRRLLAFARRQPLRPSRIKVNTLVDNTVRLVRRLLGQDVEVSLDLACDVWDVSADPSQLEAALVNLATNARDAMPLGGRLTITTASRHLEILEREPVDLILSDIVMPGGLDGLELARLAQDRWPSVKIVLSSGFPYSHPDLAAYRFLGKPYSKETLAATLRAAFGR